MKIYHTSNTKVESPDIIHSRAFLDFGKGFYATNLESQARKYADKFLKAGEQAWMSVYELNKEWAQGFNVKVFDAYNEEWLDFVIANRNGEDVEKYDAVEGGVANDTVFETIDLYRTKLIGKRETLRRLRYRKPNHQICFLNQDIIDNNITFEQCVEIKKS